MPFLLNLARMNCTTPGVGPTLKLASPVRPFLSFDEAGAVDGRQYYITINDFVGNNVAMGLATYTALGTTIHIDSIYRSSGASNTSMISLSGQAEIGIDPPKEFFDGFLSAVGTIRRPAAAAVVAILTSDIEVGIDTSATAVTANLPSATAWAAANQNGLELTLLDYTGNADTHNVTPVLSGSDIFVGGFTPQLLNPFALIKLRPVPGVGWYLRQ